MIAKVSLLVVITFLQANVVPAQKPGELIEDMTSTQMWNPYSWMTPYFSIAYQAWADYFNKAQEVSNKLYQQWDKTGAGNIFNIGLGTANQAKDQAKGTADKTQEQAKDTADKTQEQAKDTADKTQEQAKDTADKTQEQAKDTADKTQEKPRDTTDKPQDEVESTTAKTE